MVYGEAQVFKTISHMVVNSGAIARYSRIVVRSGGLARRNLRCEVVFHCGISRPLSRWFSAAIMAITATIVFGWKNPTIPLLVNCWVGSFPLSFSFWKWRLGFILLIVSIGLSSPSFLLFRRPSNFRRWQDWQCQDRRQWRDRWRQDRWQQSEFQWQQFVLPLFFSFFPPSPFVLYCFRSSISLLFALSPLLFIYFFPSIFCFPFGLDIYEDWLWLCVSRLWNGLWFMTFHYWWLMSLIVDDFLFLNIFICYINSW